LISEKAFLASRSKSSYISSLALGKDIIIFEGLKEFIFLLQKHGNNINQLTMLAHQGKLNVINIDETNKILKDIWMKLDSITEIE